jgi:hypothetical protein
MSEKYSTYIQLSPNYESVVDLDAEERNPNLWQEYIVHDDMKKTLEAICRSIEWEGIDKRRSFWIHGAYGTGKSYAAIVLKHLFEDKVANIEDFLSRPSLAPFKRRFIRVRQKGAYLVAWKSGATDIKSGTHLMMEMEVKIKEKLAEKFGEKAYYGTSSLINAAKEAIDNNHINWAGIFDDPIYGLSDEYETLDDFRRVVLNGNPDAVQKVKRVCDGLHFSMFTDVVEKFEGWLKDIIAGNGLKDTGIVFIWDEFTGFLRDSGDDNVLQRLSEFCKQPNAPFFMCLIVHRDPAWVNQLGSETYERILHRYHELEFHITESAAYDLIGDSILPRSGMKIRWEEEKKTLLGYIAPYKSEFDNLEQNVNIYERMNKLCPLHPMTVSMLATVAQNFGASQRTLFRFMKDRAEPSEDVGFTYYIDNNGPDDWYWLTADYLWDYFFTRESDVRDFNADAKKIIQYYQNKIECISDDYAKHVFKAAMLLIAVVNGSNVSNLYSRQPGNRITATRNTLYKLFRGQLNDQQIDGYLDTFEQIGVLRLDRQPNGDARLELPYTGNVDLFDGRLNATKKKYTRHTLFSKTGAFSMAMEGYLWDSTRATFGRVHIVVCSSETNSFNTRLGEIKEELRKSPYKIGVLVVPISTADEYETFKMQIKKYAAEDASKRLVVALLKEPCTDGTLDRWHRAVTHKELSSEEGKKSSAAQYENEAAAEIAKWCAAASAGQIFASYGNVQFSSLYGKSDLIRRIENDVLYTVFPAAPERIVTNNTAFKKGNGAAIAGLTKDVKNNQVNNIVNALKGIGAWDVSDLSKLASLQGDNTTVVTELAKYFQTVFEQGAKINLDTLWAELQKPPFGYYSSLTAEVFIGLALRPFIKGSFNWIDHQNNTNLPTPENLASMVSKMMSGQTLNNYLSSGSAIWQKFKPYAKAVFDLEDTKCVSEAETRKYILVKIAEIGVPLWSLKYVLAEKLGGEDAKSVIDKITDSFCDFTYAISADQESVMDTVLTLFNGHGGLKKVISNTIADKTAMYAAFKRFVFNESAELKHLYDALRLTDKDLFDNLSAYMQKSIDTWRKDDVTAKLPELTKELGVISVLNAALGTSEKTYKEIQSVLNNVFAHMKIPGSVIETLSYSWISAMKTMRRISTTAWRPDISAIGGLIDTLKDNAKSVWDILSQPKIILEAVLDKRNITYSDDEASAIYTALKPDIYEIPVQAFYAALDKLLETISYTRNASEAKQLWKDKTGFDTVRKWCNSSNAPITWLFDDSGSAHIETITDIQDNKTVDKGALELALSFLKNNTLVVLRDAKAISGAFFATIGESYRAAFETDEAVLLARLKTNGKLTADVYSWAGKISEIHEVLDAFLQNKYQEEAKRRIVSMPVDELRRDVLVLLERNPQMYNYFLKK